jgi:hypothetical protein
MWRIFGSLALLSLWAGAGNAQKYAKPVPVFEIKGPTIVAFFSPLTEGELESDPGTSEVLSDFKFSNSQVNGPLQKAGIEFRQTRALSFKVRNGKKVRTIQTGKTGLGYYFIAPGKRPHLAGGVMTHTDLLELARKYFGKPIP